MTQEALKLAIKLRNTASGYWTEHEIPIIEKLIEILAHPEQEPVAWRFKTGTWWNREVHWRYVLSLNGTEGLLGLEPLYTTPPQRKPLTDDELVDLWYKQSLDWLEFARAIEAAHGIKEKNT